jgi:hypothetical protein
LITWRYAGTHCPHAPTIFVRCRLLQLSAIGTMTRWFSYLSEIIAGVELTTFFEDLDQMELARIPNDREFFSIELCVVLFGGLFHLVAARRIYNPYSGKTKTRRR